MGVLTALAATTLGTKLAIAGGIALGAASTAGVATGAKAIGDSKERKEQRKIAVEREQMVQRNKQRGAVAVGGGRQLFTEGGAMGEQLQSGDFATRRNIFGN